MDPRTAKMLAERRQPPDVSAPSGSRLSLYRSSERWVRANKRLASIGIALFVAIVAGGYFLLVTQPRLEREQIALQQQRATQEVGAQFDARQPMLEACLATADAARADAWEKACQERRQRSGCALPRDVVEQQKRVYTDQRTDCMRRFSLGSGQP